MKKKFVFLIVLMAMFSHSTFAQIKVSSSGNVGIGESPSGDFDLTIHETVRFHTAIFGLVITEDYSFKPTLKPLVNNYGYIGTSDHPFRKIYYNDLEEISDKRKKENIRSITGSLDCILNMKGYKYDLKMEALGEKISSEYPELQNHLDADRKNKLGFLAQEVNEVLPEAVGYDSITDIYTINYIHIIPVLVEAIKEQQTIMDNLIYEISELKSESSDNLKSGLVTNDYNLNEPSNQPILYQNEPNPFSEDTEIKFFLPDNVKDARIYLYNMQGNQVSSIIIHQRGLGKEIIHGFNLNPGMYMYTMIVDNLEIDTKRMILTDK